MKAVGLGACLVLAACTMTVNEQIIGGGDTSSADGAADVSDGTTDATDGEDGTEAGDGTDGSDSTDASDGTDGLTDGTDWIPTGTNTVCATAAEPGDTVGWPFTGLQYTPQTEKSGSDQYAFTCTKCPNGYDGVGGKYRRFIDDNASLPDPKDSAETWEFIGNAFINIIDEVDSGTGKRARVTARGYYFCPEPDEFFDQIEGKEWWNVVLVYTEVDPPGAFGIDPGVADPCFFGFSTEGGFGNDLGVACNLFWDPKGTWQTTDTYCRIGATVNGRSCEDPFAAPE